MYSPFKTSASFLGHERRYILQGRSVPSQKQFLSLFLFTQQAWNSLTCEEGSCGKYLHFLLAQHTAPHGDTSPTSLLLYPTVQSTEAHPLHLGLVLSLHKGDVKAGKAELAHALVVTHGYFGILKAAAGRHIGG